MQLPTLRLEFPFTNLVYLNHKLEVNTAISEHSNCENLCFNLANISILLKGIKQHKSKASMNF